MHLGINSTSGVWASLKSILNHDGADIYPLAEAWTAGLPPDDPSSIILPHLNPQRLLESTNPHDLRLAIYDALQDLAFDAFFRPRYNLISSSATSFDLTAVLEWPENPATSHHTPPLPPMPLRGVSEIVGPPGSGKTQLALSIVAHALVHDWLTNKKEGNSTDSKVIWVDSEGTFQSSRLREILSARIALKHISKPTCPTSHLPSLSDSRILDHLLEQVVVFKLDEKTLDPLARLFNQIAKDDTLVKGGLSGKIPLRAIIVDSIAALARRIVSIPDRYASLGRVGRELHHLRGILPGSSPILFLNQITSYRAKELVLPYDPISSKSDLLTLFEDEALNHPLMWRFPNYRDPILQETHLGEPALDLNWSNTIQSRFYCVPATFLSDTFILGDPEEDGDCNIISSAMKRPRPLKGEIPQPKVFKTTQQGLGYTRSLRGPASAGMTFLLVPLLCSTVGPGTRIPCIVDERGVQMGDLNDGLE